MWRSLFLALGIFSIALGAETLVVDKFLMAESKRLPRVLSGNPNATTSYTNSTNNYQAGYNGYQAPQVQAPQARDIRSRIVQTKDWMPWSLLAAGSIIVLYTYSLPNRGSPD